MIGQSVAVVSFEFKSCLQVFGHIAEYLGRDCLEDFAYCMSDLRNIQQFQQRIC